MVEPVASEQNAGIPGRRRRVVAPPRVRPVVHVCKPAAASAVPPTMTSPAAISRMRVKELKGHLTAVGVDHSGALEKSELVALAMAQVTASATAEEVSAKDPEQLSMRELERQLAAMGVDYSDAIDKEELVELYQAHVSTR